MNKILKKILIAGLCIGMIMPSNVLAKEFNDVKKNGPYGWAYPYIDELSDKGIIKGYNDNEYKPDNAVSFEEVHQLLKGIVNPNKSEIKEAVKKYEDDMDKYNIASWAKEAIAISLKNRVIDTRILKEASEKKFVGNDIELYPDRNTVAKYFALALKLPKDTSTSYLKHKDKDNIPTELRGYLASLIKEGIFSATGSDGKFEGERYVKRSEMAKITKLSYDYSRNEGIRAENLNESNLLKIEGKVLLISSINNVDTIIVENSGKNHQFKVDSKTKYKMGLKEISFKDIDKGQEIKIEYLKEENSDLTGKAIRIEVEDNSRKLVGYINRSDSNSFNVDYIENTSSLDFKSSNKIRTNKTDTFYMDRDVKIYELGKKISCKDLYGDELVEFETNSDGKVIKVIAYPKEATVRGKVVKITEPTSSRVGNIVLKLDDGNQYTFYTEEYRYSLRVFDDLRVSDSAVFSTNYRIIKEKQSDFNQEFVTGRIVRAYYDNSSYNKNGKDWIITLKTSSRELSLYTDKNTFVKRYSAKYHLTRPEDIEGIYAKLKLDGRYVEYIEEIDQEASFEALCQVLNISNNQGFPGFYETQYEVKVVESNNKSVKLGSIQKIRLDNPKNFLYMYDIFKISGTVDRNGNIQILSDIEFVRRENKEIDSDIRYR